MQKIDFHTHILPAADDGAVDREMSLTMLNALSEQDVETVVLTPHYYSHREPLDAFVARRKKAYGRLCDGEEKLPVKTLLGAEVYFSEYLFNLSDLSALCIENTKTMLLELPFTAKPEEKLFLQLERLINEYSLNIVLAHIERYPSFVKSHRAMEELASLGCVCQVNLSSFQRFGKRRLFSLAEKGFIGVVGTDCHNLTTRPPLYSEGFDKLKKHVSDETISYIADTMTYLLR